MPYGLWLRVASHPIRLAIVRPQVIGSPTSRLSELQYSHQGCHIHIGYPLAYVGVTRRSPAPDDFVICLSHECLYSEAQGSAATVLTTSGYVQLLEYQ